MFNGGIMIPTRDSADNTTTADVAGMRITSSLNRTAPAGANRHPLRRLRRRWNSEKVMFPEIIHSNDAAINDKLSWIISEFCFLPDEHGPCSENQIKWFYDSRDGICKQFRYGGCQSNGNNYNTREECEYRCGEIQGTKSQELQGRKNCPKKKWS